MPKLILESFKVERESSYRRTPGQPVQYECKARFKHGTSNFDIKLPEKTGELILQLCRGAIIDASGEVVSAIRMAAEIEEQIN